MAKSCEQCVHFGPCFAVKRIYYITVDIVVNNFTKEMDNLNVKMFIVMAEECHFYEPKMEEEPITDLLNIT